MGVEVPPEVPDEFAEAYRAAYEAAMAQTPPPGVHRRVASGGPSRRSFLAPQDPEVVDEGPSRRSFLAPQDPEVAPQEPEVAASDDEGPSRRSFLAPQEPKVAAERHKPAVNMAAVMLVVLALVLFLGAYLLGLVFASRVGG